MKKHLRLLWLSSSLWYLACSAPSINTTSEDQQKLAIDLGKSLFFDKQLSRNFTISCATCHKPELAFTDALPKSIGVDGVPFFRNAPSLLNTAVQPYFFADGGVSSLPIQAISPIEEHREMNFSMAQLAYRLQLDEHYVKKFELAYQRKPDDYSITRALAAYQSTLISLSTKYDLWLKLQDNTVFSREELAGKSLFFGKGKCNNCHSGKYFSDFKFHEAHHSDTSDIGRMRITLQPADKYKFKTPMLRNVALTAPYLHNGSVASLEELLQEMAAKGEHSLTQNEQKALISFLTTLNDTALSRYIP